MPDYAFKVANLILKDKAEYEMKVERSVATQEVATVVKLSASSWEKGRGLL
jgi:hypothetical protein